MTQNILHAFLLGMRQYLAMASKLGEMQKVLAGRYDDDMMANEPPKAQGFFVSNCIGSNTKLWRFQMGLG